MKKIILGAAVLAAMMATSCQNEELVASQEQGNVVVKASTMNESRTFVQGRTIYWSEGDVLMAYGEDVLGSLTLVGQGGSTDGKFVGYVSGKKENLEYLVYPAEMANYKDGKVTIEIGTINKANSNAPMFARWGSNVTFEQLTGMVRIQINDVPAKNNDLEVTGKGIGTAVFENGKITTYSTKDNTIKVTGLTAGSNEICIPVFTKNTTAQDVKLKFKLAGATKELTLPLAQKALTATNVPVLTYDAATNTLSEDTTLPENGNESEIKTLTELYQFANLVKEGNTYEGKTVTLGADIDLDNMPWTPISGFKGTFDGAQFTISNLNVAVEGAASAGLFADGIGATIKNLILQNVNVNGNWRTGAIIGNGSCVTIENCQVIGGTVTSTPDSNDDNGNHAGGIVGYLAADGGDASVTGCSVTGLTISAYRDVAGIAGTVTAADGGIPTVNNNKVTATTIIADQTVKYVEVKAANAGEIVGRKVVEPTMIDNTVGEDVIIKAYVKEAESIAQTLTNSAQNIEVILMNDIDLPISSLGTQTGGSGEYKLGGESTESIIIDLNGKTLNVTTTYWSAIGAMNDNATITIKNGSMTSTGNSAGTWNAWDLRFSNCNYVFEGVEFAKAVALDNVERSTKMNNVTITDTHNTDTYGLWITAEGQTVTLEDCVIDMTPATDGRGIKIDNQYVNEADQKKVILNVKNVAFKTEEKAAIVVKSLAGAEITINKIDITEVAEDKVCAVWVDEDAASWYDLVTVNGGCKKLEGAEFYVDVNGVAHTGTQKGLAEALKYKVDEIHLMSGEYQADIYNITEREVLNIVGTEGTKIAFNNLQVRASQFKQFTVENCEIERMPNKGWGHLVFGSGIKADGVYTVRNCTFNGVGSQGIYINENMSGATYNIENCTFNGDFGDEGAITIQNNDGVEHNVNITGCKFNNIPNTSHKVCVHYAYDGFNLTTDLEVKDIYWKANN